MATTTPSTTTVSTADGQEDTSFGKTGAYRLDCSRCGHVATYAGQQFSAVEARRHDAWCNNR